MPENCELFPKIEAWPGEVDGEKMLDDIAAEISRFVKMDGHYADACALWCVAAHLFQKFEVFPRLGITSPEKGCGKTTLLDVLEKLVSKPLYLSSTTPAALFRIIDKYRPTILLDEGDTYLRRNEELRNVLNSGHRKQGMTTRSASESHEPQLFSTFTPIAMAAIGVLPETVADRSVMIELRRKLAHEVVDSFRVGKSRGLEELCRKAATWAQKNADQIAALDPIMPIGVTNRPADNWSPLLAIADVAGSRWAERARLAAQKITSTSAADTSSEGAMLMTDIRKLFSETEGGWISSADIVHLLNSHDERPWALIGKTGLTPSLLASKLKPYGVSPKQRRVGDGNIRGYNEIDFADAFERYIPATPATPLQPADSIASQVLQLMLQDGITEGHNIESLKKGILVTSSQTSPYLRRALAKGQSQRETDTISDSHSIS